MNDERLDVTLLKNLPFGGAGPDGAAGVLPYRIDHLRAHGIRLHATDAPFRPALRRFHDPSVQTLRLLPALVRHPVTLAMFESSAHPIGWLRSLIPPLRRSRLAVLSCWLGELVAEADPRRLDRYRRAYRTVDRLWCFSQNQVPLLVDALQLDPARVAALPFGIDDELFAATPPALDGPIVAVGRDRGRDWRTLLAALDATGVPATVVCNPAALADLDVPSTVTARGRISRSDYRALLREARAVVVCTHVLAYPSGQSVLLEAMATARACLVTDTPAMRDYVEPGGPALLVPPGDRDALAEGLQQLHTDDGLVSTLGRRAREAVDARFTAARMWATVASELHRLAEAR